MNLLDRIRYTLRFELNHRLFRQPKRRAWPDYADGTSDRIQSALESEGVLVEPLWVDLAEYEDYLKRADYSKYGAYYAWGAPAFAEKSLEHFLAAKLLCLRPGEVFIDIASDTSPVPDIYSSLFEADAYRQDLAYPVGVHGDRIGGDAGSLPLEDEAVDAMTLHCSFEHFEGDGDTRFVASLSRVLRPGGRVCILPLYLFTEFAVMTDPGDLAWGARPQFDDGAVIHSARHWRNRHGRFYDADRLKARVLDHAGDLDVTVYRVMNPQAVDASCYIQFALAITKPKSPAEVDSGRMD